MRPDPSQFTFWHPVHVRFKDIDIGGHAHHSLALVYFEEARAAYWKEVVGRRELDEIDFILAEASVRYHQRVLYPLEMMVGVRVSVLGRKHFVMEYLSLGENGEELLSGETTMVMFDYGSGRSKKMPPEVRAAVEAREGLGGVGGERERTG
ncbi:MAG: thioesterase family protein [Gemmatimonadota bacterium]